uniref:Laminin G domain-containing protein n=1 Tax=Amphilophus citrinellus TaxID=61819 RepID=A0A3Q0S7E6_AMPCI
VTFNLSEIASIKSSFEFRTFDPEGLIFYGDTKNGADWFVLSLKEGVPLMQISKEDVLVSVAGTPKLNDGKWHTVSVESCSLPFTSTVNPFAKL